MKTLVLAFFSALTIASSASFALVLPAPVATAIGDSAYSMFAGQPFAQSVASGATGGVSWGGVVRYAGTAVIAASATAAALSWFYDTVKQQSGTSLDGYYTWTDYSSLDIQSNGFINGSAWRRWAYLSRTNSTNYYWDDTTNDCGTNLSCVKDKVRFLRPTNFQGIYTNYVWVDGNNGNMSSWRAPVRPTLENYASGNYPGGSPHPDVQDGLARVMRKYATDVLAPGGAPGLSFSPSPNANQFKTTPPFVAYLDSDNDGFSDVDELAAYPVSDPMDPQSKPQNDPNANPDGTCKTGYGRSPGVTACVRVAVTPDPNANADNTCKTGYERLSGASACTLIPIPDPNANTNGTCKTGFLRLYAGAVCTPAPTPDPNTNADGTCKAGFTSDAAGRCQPDKPKECTFPAIVSADGKSCVEPVPVTTGTGECAQVSSQGFAGFVANFWGSLTNTFLCVFKPQQDIPSKLTARFDTIKTKFPFSVVTALQNKITATGDTNPDGLPSSLGNIPLDWSGINTLWAIIKTASGFLIWFSFIWFILSKVTPQATI